MEDTTNTHSLAFVEALYADYLRDAEAVSPEWRRYFERMPGPGGNGSAARLGPSFKPASLFHARGETNGRATAAEAAAESGGTGLTLLQERVDQIVRNYRERGHVVAEIDPLSRPRVIPEELDPAHLHLNEADMERIVSTDSMVAGPKNQSLRRILRRLRNTYCRSIGAQFTHIHDSEVRHWLQHRMEAKENRLKLSRDEQQRILRRLTDAVVFERFIQKKYIGAKSFSLEGAETLIPLLDLAIDYAGEQKIDEIVLGMAHRGRLNVLTNIMGKSAANVFREFDDVDPQFHMGGGDVKYHLGYSSDWTTSSGRKLHLSLCFNPSHLEFINPVAVGRVRAKQDRAGDKKRSHGMTLLIHGDAAVVGEGVFQETLNLSQLRAYETGGTLHVVVNNQIGFTTPPGQYRSSEYCTDVAKMLQIPIFHVNGEDPEAVAQVVRLAMAFRKKFKRDVVIDMYGYRRLGHNEGDEPAFTQPLLYKVINKRKSVRQAYLQRLIDLGGVTREEADRMVAEREEALEESLAEARRSDYTLPRRDCMGIWAGYKGGLESEVADVKTGLPTDRLTSLLRALTTLPEDFHPNRKIERGLKARRRMAEGERPIDWASAEALALASLATEGLRVRLSGQDTARGTFSQRHAILHDDEDGHTYMPLANLAPDQAPVEIHNSPLSEAGVLGFEYGYSLDTPDGLVAWEAQFGDFVNAGQVIIDQFISSAEDKWRRLSGIVLLLPHGFEGQGPEHSSARLERFLVLAAEDNIQIAYPTTPAQYFHLLRRQVLRRWRKPLIVLTPKSLLRHGEVVSTLEDLADEGFQRVIPDRTLSDQKAVDRVLLCSGKVYYDLLKHREELRRSDVAIVRMEQLYPFPLRELKAALEPYADGTPVVWVQEEPRNMGAWPSLWAKFGDHLFDRLPYSAVTRPESASPATGSASAHKMEQERLMTQAFGGE